METVEIKLRDEYIKLGQALKAAGIAESGVDAKYSDPGRHGTGKWKDRTAAREKTFCRRCSRMWKCYRKSCRIDTVQNQVKF